MTQISGCSNKQSKNEVINKFSDYITMFPSEDLSFLYDKEGNTSNLKDGDLGTWIVSSFKYTTKEKEWKAIGVLLRFNKNTRQAQGEFSIKVYDAEDVNNVISQEEYPVYYDKSGIHLVNENVDESVKEEVANFKIMNEFISLDKVDLENRESKVFYNGEVPMYDVTYKLDENDRNIQRIKELYPELLIDKDNISLVLEGEGTPWNTTSSLSLNVFLDNTRNNFLTNTLYFSRSDKF